MTGSRLAVTDNRFGQCLFMKGFSNNTKSTADAASTPGTIKPAAIQKLAAG
jgi:hypothetical protein